MDYPTRANEDGKGALRCTASLALDVFQHAAALRQNSDVFPGVQSGRPMSDMALSMLLRGRRPRVTVPGFRSTFRDWAAETTAYPRDLCEMALAHVLGGVEGV
jgi:integrase